MNASVYNSKPIKQIMLSLNAIFLLYVKFGSNLNNKIIQKGVSFRIMALVKTLRDLTLLTMIQLFNKAKNAKTWVKTPNMF